jgi:hypothetical protein
MPAVGRRWGQWALHPARPARWWPQAKRAWRADGGMPALAARPRWCHPPGGGRRGSGRCPPTAACPRPRMARSVPPTRPGPQGQRRWCPPGDRPAPGAWPRWCRPPGGGRRGRVGGPPTAAGPRPAHGPVGAARPSVRQHHRRPTPHAADRRTRGAFAALARAGCRRAPERPSAGRLMQTVGPLGQRRTTFQLALFFTINLLSTERYQQLHYEYII